MRIPWICSNRRAGTHLLAKLLYTNFSFTFTNYEDLHFSHRRVPEEPFLHIHRHVLPSMVSSWRMREFFSVDKTVSFSEFIRVPIPKLLRTTTGNGLREGLPDPIVSMSKHFVKSFPETWLENGTRFFENAALNVSYADVVDDPVGVLNAVATTFSLERLPFAPVASVVGWTPTEKEELDIPTEDYEFLETYQRRAPWKSLPQT